jgi:hypothetical protein
VFFRSARLVPAQRQRRLFAGQRSETLIGATEAVPFSSLISGDETDDRVQSRMHQDGRGENGGRNSVIAGRESWLMHHESRVPAFSCPGAKLDAPMLERNDHE